MCQTLDLMRYKSRLYIIDKTPIYNPNDMRYNTCYGLVIAMCKVPAISNRVEKYPTSNTYFYIDDVDSSVLKQVRDLHGKHFLKEIPLKDMIKILYEVSENDNHMHYKYAISLLESFNDLQYENLIVLHYGY